MLSLIPSQVPTFAAIGQYISVNTSPMFSLKSCSLMVKDSRLQNCPFTN